MSHRQGGFNLSHFSAKSNNNFFFFGYCVMGQAAVCFYRLPLYTGPLKVRDPTSP